MGKRKPALKSLVLVAVFVTVLVVAAGPARLRAAAELGPLAVAFGFAWFVTFLVGWIVFDALKQGARAATALTICALLAVGAVGHFAPPPEEQVYVWFRMEANFSYRGSEDNLPIENVALRFPCPNVENEPAAVMSGIWHLYYLDEENVLRLQMIGTENVILEFYGYYGDRTENLEILLMGIDDTPHGPKIYYNLDKLYPREVFMITKPVEVPKRDTGKITLLEIGENQRTDAYYHHYPFEKPINLSFWARLSKRTNDNYEVVETFSRVYDNGNPGWYWLYLS